MKLEAEESLENLIKLSAEGARQVVAESLRPKDRAENNTEFIKSALFFPELLNNHFRRKEKWRLYYF